MKAQQHSVLAGVAAAMAFLGVTASVGFLYLGWQFRAIESALSEQESLLKASNVTEINPPAAKTDAAPAPAVSTDNAPTVGTAATGAPLPVTMVATSTTPMTGANTILLNFNQALRKKVSGIGMQTIGLFIFVTFVGISVFVYLQRAFVFIVARIDKIMKGVGNASTIADELRSSGQAVAEGAQKQAHALETTSSSLEEISSMSRTTAASAETAKDCSDDAKIAVERGVEEMQTMREAMSGIQNSVADMRRAMEEIKKSSAGIATIMKTIDEISFQTKILALNAAVEAARAGEAGVGFAVVADEVRNLATRCAQAANETTVQIEDSIEKSELGEKVSVKVMDRLRDVMEKTQKVDARLGDILNKSNEVDKQMAEIALASKEESTGIVYLAKSLFETDQVTQANAQSAEKTASSLRDMHEDTLDLTYAVEELIVLVGAQQGSDLGKGTLKQMVVPLINLLKGAKSITRKFTQSKKSLPLTEQLEDSFPDKQTINRFVGYLEKLVLKPGDYLFRQAEPPDKLYFVESGEVAVQIEIGKGNIKRLRTLGPGNVVGEMGLYIKSPRSASIVVENEAVLFALSMDALETMQTRDPLAAAAFHSFIVRLLSKRLTIANKEMESLRQKAMNR